MLLTYRFSEKNSCGKCKKEAHNPTNKEREMVFQVILSLYFVSNYASNSSSTVIENMQLNYNKLLNYFSIYFIARTMNTSRSQRDG